MHLTVLGAFKKIFRKAQQATQVLHDDQKIYSRKLISRNAETQRFILNTDYTKQTKIFRSFRVLLPCGQMVFDKSLINSKKISNSLILDYKIKFDYGI